MASAEGDAVFETLSAARSQWDSKSPKVREVFENAPHYLKGRQVDIRFRTQAVKHFSQGIAWRRLLDIGCGDGTISLQLLTAESQFTLLDLSASMAAIAKANVPTALAANVNVRNENFQAADFTGEVFDLVVTVGVMAHVDSPDKFLGKIKKVLRPGGSLIIEFTDCRHFMGRLERFTSNLKEFLKPGRFRTNRLSFAQVSQLFERHNLKLVSTFRYSMVPIPGIQKAVKPGVLYKMVSMIFGNPAKNRNAWLGNQYICLLKAE